MAYIGKALVGILNENKVVDSMTGDGSDTTLTLSRTPGSVNNVEVFIDGIYQTPDVEYTLAGDTITFTTAPELNVTVVAVSGADSTIINPAAGSITGAKIVDNAITGAKVAALSASKLTGALPALSGSGLTGLPAANLTGALPALDGSALTGLPAANLTGALPAIDGSALTGVSGVTKSASDPLITTNPSGGVGQLFLNTTSGEIYSCTDATTDANVWTNIGGGDGDISPWSYVDGASVATFSVGGTIGPASGLTSIDKVIVTSDTPVNDTGNLAQGANCSGGASSQTHAYSAGRMTAPLTTVERFAFASEGTITDAGDLDSSGNIYGGGCASETHGYVVYTSTNPPAKYTLAATVVSSTITDIGGTIRAELGVFASKLHAYACGGVPDQAPGGSGNVCVDIIDRFSFVNEGSWAGHGTLNLARMSNCDMGTQTETDGYFSGGNTNSNTTWHTEIDKISFASSGTATDIGDLTVAVTAGSASTSTTGNVYIMHGKTSGSGHSTTLNKFNTTGSFASSVISGLSVSKRSGAACHN